MLTRFEVRTSLWTLTMTGSGRVSASGWKTSMWPGGMFFLALPFLMEMEAVPSRVMNLTYFPAEYSMRVVVPVMAAVTVAVRMVAPPAFLGTWRRKDPSWISISRLPGR